MKLGQFKTIAEPPMSDVSPPSDYIMAQRLAKVHEKFTILDSESHETWQMQQVRAKLKHELKTIWKNFDEGKSAYENWIAAGRPDLSGSVLLGNNR